MVVDLKLVEWIKANRIRLSRSEIMEKFRKEGYSEKDIMDSYEEVVKKEAKKGAMGEILGGGTKSMVVTIVLSIFFPGVGHIYTGAKGIGILIIILYALGYLLCFTLIGAILGFPLISAMWLWGLIGSIIRCDKINKGAL